MLRVWPVKVRQREWIAARLVITDALESDLQGESSVVNALAEQG
jgi:hypothetical protein